MTNGDISLKEYFEAQWKAHHKEHVQLQMAIDKAVAELDRRLLEMNQFRAQIQQERDMFITKAEYNSRHRELETRFHVDKDAQDKALKALELRNSNWDGRFWAIGGIITVFSGLLTVLVNLAFRYWAR